MTNWTYKAPEAVSFVRNFIKIFGRRHKDLVPLLARAQCEFDISNTYGGRPHAYTVSIRLSVPEEAIDRLASHQLRDDLIAAAQDAIPHEAGLDVVDVRVLPFLDADGAPTDALVAEVLDLRPDFEVVRATWQKVIDRRDSDPDGAITSSRALLESLLKHMLDELGVLSYDPRADLPVLYNAVAKELGLSPSSKDASGRELPAGAKQILSGCISVVHGFAALRNQLGDAHGKGKGALPAEPRHAELAVNMAFALATFLVRTLEKRRKTVPVLQL